MNVIDFVQKKKKKDEVSLELFIVSFQNSLFAHEFLMRRCFGSKSGVQQHFLITTASTINRIQRSKPPPIAAATMTMGNFFLLPCEALGLEVVGVGG